MATGKRYYWIKLKDSFMNSEVVDFLMSQPNGANYVVLYQMLCLKTINTGGRLTCQIGDVIIPFDMGKIQRDCKWFSLDTIRIALGLYKQLGLIYEEQDGTLVLVNHAEMVGSETDYAEKNRRMRSNAANKRLQAGQYSGHESGHNVSADCGENVPIDIRDKRKDIRDIKNRDKDDGTAAVDAGLSEIIRSFEDNLGGFPPAAREDLLNGMNTELARHGTKAGTADVTHDDPTMTAKLAVANLRVSPSYYSQRVGKSAWERSLARGVKHKGAKTEYKTVEFELEGFDDKEGTFSGYGAVFSNIDSGGDIIEPGAFTKTIAEGIGRVKILSGHNDSLLPIGIPTELREDAKGLFMSAKISDTTLGRDVKTLIHDGVLCELSIGYDPVVFDYDENGIRHLREVKLWEISVVTWAMNEQAVITDHKSDDAATRIEAEAQAIVTEVKAGRKISASRMKSLKDACTSMKAATKLLDKIISEAQGDNGKGHPPVSAHKSVERKSAPKKTVEIIF